MLNGKIEVFAKFLIDPSIVDADDLYGETFQKSMQGCLPKGINMVDYQVADSDSKLLSEKYVNYLLDYYMNAPYGEDFEKREPPMSLIEFAKYDCNRQFGLPKELLDGKGEENNG